MDAVHLKSRSLRAYAGWLTVLGAALLIAFVSFEPAAAQDEEELPNPVAFAQQSYANVCAECHGGDGNGGPVPETDRVAPSLRDDGVTEAYLDLVLRTGRMPPAGDPFDNRAREVFYDDAEREAMVTYLTDEFGLEQDLPEVSEGDVSLGLETFALNCAHCHGNSGAGGTAGQAAWTPRVNNLSPESIAEAIRVGPFEMPAFGPDVINDDEVDGIAAYLGAVDAEKGTPVFGLVELNPVFASGFVALFAGVMIGSLLYIGGRPVPFENVEPDEVEAPVIEDHEDDDTVEATPVATSVGTPTGTTLMPGDPEYDRYVNEAQPGEKGIPYLDENTGAITTGETENITADQEGRDGEGGSTT